MDSQSNCLFITYVEKEGPFLKVWGQTDKNTSLYIEQVLHGFANQFDSGLCVPHPESLQIGILCCAKYKDSKYYRAKITNLNFLQNRYIEVNFVDYGHRDVVPVTNIRSLEGFDTAFLSIPPQASCFLLAEAVCPRGEWNEVYLEEICKEIRYTEVNFSIIAQVTKHYLVRLFVGVNDLAIILISKGLMRHTSLTTQEAVLLSMMPRASVSQQPAAQQSIATYKAFTLEPGSQYEVYVSYVTDGPCNFSVQLKQSEEVLGKLMKEINSMTLTPIEGIPIPGTVCLARCMEDGHICRAVVTNEVDGQFKVFYVDFGNFEVISLEALYEIPFKFVIPKVMAIRFALAGVEKSTVTIEMQCAFKHFVDNRLIHMKVMPMTSRAALPRCELWDPESQISALDIITKAASAAYPDHFPLNRGFTQSIKVSFVFSCNRFYVQLKSKQDELLRLMLDIQVLCRDAEKLNSTTLKPGLPCYALFESDQQWYRCQIVELLPGGHAKVHYVDYGNEDVVPVSLLKAIEGKQLTILRPQAIECCLNGYQNMEPDLERDTLLEELILEKEFTMKVVEMQGKKALVELIDSANYNVASLLLDKIAVTRSQVSPMLVQAGNKIEHRKQSQPFVAREQKRPERNRNNYETNEENNDNTWRQNNKGFNKNYDRSKRDELNDSTDSERHSNKSFGKNDRNRNDFNARNTEGSSWKQNKGFNKNQDRFSRDNNRNNDWGGSEGNERKNFRNKDDWSSRDNDRKNIKSPDADWGNENNTNNTQTDDWGGDNRENTKRNFKPRENNDWGDNKKDDWGNNRENTKRNFKPRENNDWSDNKKDDWGNNRENTKRNFKPRENNEWGDNSKKDEWGGSDNTRERGDRRGGFQPRDRDGFKPRKDRFEDGGGDWNNDKSGGFKKREFKRETSELSSSGSEKSFRKGGFKDNKFKSKQTDRAPRRNFGNDSGGDAWNVSPLSTSTVVEVPNPAPATAKFPTFNVEGTESHVTISWFHNPSRFYCQIENTQEEFKKLMGDIQEAYKSRQPTSATVGAPIIGLFPEDRVLYRAEVLETIGSRYKVFYVDYGNVSVIDKVWPIEMRFMELPAQAICCKLAGIEPPNDTWPDAGSYSQYFDKKQFLCRFIATEDNGVAIQLESDGEDIASALLRDGLAKSMAPSPEPELPLLIGQQFRALLLSVNSLADFSMSLQNGCLLKCSVFNVGESTESWEDNLKEKIEQILIVYVDDLKEDRLEVTLYDQTGLKIKLIDKDEAAYESVELLCPYLILYSKLTGEISHVEDGTVYIQPTDCAENIEYLLNSAFEFYENSTLETPLTPTEGFVYAVKGSDTNWYRGRVTTFDDTQATVNYFDYGNSEQVNLDALRELAAEFMEIPIMCVGVIVKDASEELIGKVVTIDLTFGESGLEGVIHDDVAQVEEQPPVNEVEEQPPINEVEGTHVVLSHIDSPSDFYLQLSQSVDAIEQLQARLQEEVIEMTDMENPVVGVLCAALYSLDQQWYRAQVLDADSDITTVRFVDYGNTDVLDNHSTRVKTLPADLLSLEVYATRCCLKIKPVDVEWSSQASERFEQLTDVENLTVQFISQDEKINYVELYSNGGNVRDVLIQEKLALLDEVIPEGSSSVGFVSHLNSPSEFWIQLENCVEELEWVAEQLSGAETFPELEDLAPGTLCAALFPDDQMWYRARILSNTVAGIEVLFVDYGNSCTSCSLRELPEYLVMLPPLAQKCSLQKPEKLTYWGPEMAKKFSEISADGQTTFHVKKLSTGETSSVVLLLDGVDVTTLLLPETEDVMVKSFKSLDEVTLVNMNEEELGVFRLEELPDVTWSDESVKKFAEMNSEGKTIFQAEFTSDETVRLYIGLNDIRVDLNGLKTTTPTSSPLKARSDVTTHSEIGDDKDGNTEFIKDIIACIIDRTVTNNTECVSVNLSLNNQTEEESSGSIVKSLLTDIIDRSTNQNESTKPIADDLIENGTNMALGLGVGSMDTLGPGHVESVEEVCDDVESIPTTCEKTVDDVASTPTIADITPVKTSDEKVSTPITPEKTADVSSTCTLEKVSTPTTPEKTVGDVSSTPITPEKTTGDYDTSSRSTPEKTMGDAVSTPITPEKTTGDDASTPTIPEILTSDVEPTSIPEKTSGEIVSAPTTPEKTAGDVLSTCTPEKVSTPTTPEKTVGVVSSTSTPVKVSTPITPEKTAGDVSSTSTPVKVSTPTTPEKTAGDVSSTCTPEKTVGDLSSTSTPEKVSTATTPEKTVDDVSLTTTIPAEVTQGEKQDASPNKESHEKEVTQVKPDENNSVENVEQATESEK